MKETREAETRAHLKAMSDSDVEIALQIEVVENLKMKIKAEDTSLKTKIRLFEDTEKPRLAAKLQEAENKSQGAEKQHQDLVDMSSEDSIESKLKADFQQKFDDETVKWDAQNKNLIARCDEHLRSKYIMNITSDYVASHRV